MHLALEKLKSSNSSREQSLVDNLGDMNDQVIERRKSKEEDFNAEVDTLLLGIDIFVRTSFNLENAAGKYIVKLVNIFLVIFRQNFPILWLPSVSIKVNYLEFTLKFTV